MKQWTFRQFSRVIKKNGYSLNRWCGDHAIYVHSNGKHLSVPRNLVSVIANRLIKENNLNISL